MEIFRDFKSNGFFSALKIMTLGLLLVSIYNVSSFAQSADAAINRSFSSEAQVNLYSLADTFSDPKDFYDFRQSPSSLDTLGKFYNLLNEDESLKFLSSFDQSIPVAEFRGDETFDVGYGTNYEVRGEYLDEQTGVTVREVKSMQLNRAAYDFYNLSITDGQEIAWDSIDYDSATIPVLLGNSYRDIYQSGDVLKANYYFEGVDLVVSGFLSESSSMFYKNEMNTFLDDYIVIPYPSELETVSEENLEFSGILYFAMLNADIVVDETMSADSLLRVINSLASQAGFENYTLLNVPTYMTQYKFIKEIIQQNATLLIVLGSLLSIGVLLINGVLSTHQVRRRSQHYKILWIQGQDPQKINRRNFGLALLEYTVLSIVLVTALSMLPNEHRVSLYIVFSGLTIIFLIDLLYQRHLISSFIFDAPSQESRIN